MLLWGQAPFGGLGEMPGVLAALRTGYAPDGGGGDAGGNGGDGQNAGGNGGAGGSGGQAGSDGQPFDPDRAQRLINKLREDNKAAQAAAKERDELAAKLKAIEDRDKSESERALSDLKAAQAKLTEAEQRASDLEAKYRSELIRGAIEREATKAGAIDTEAVAALIDRSKVVLGEDGAVSGADKAVADLLKAKPYLVGQASTTGAGQRQGPPPSPKPNGAPRTHEELVQAEIRALRASGQFSI